MRIKPNNQLIPLVTILSVSVLSAVIFFYAIFGIICLHGARPAGMFHDTCDVIVTEGSITWCKAVMNGPEENITITRGE